MVVTITQTAVAATTGSMLANTYATPVPGPPDHNITLEINSLAANQQALYQHITPLLQQMAAMSFNMQPSTPRHTFTVPHLTPFTVTPIQQLTIPAPPLSMQEVSTTDAEEGAQGGRGADRNSICIAPKSLLLRITWLLEAVIFRVAWAHTACSLKQADFRL